MASAEPALQAACKVRTEVLEVTRSMHDRTNAHFMLWPLCVEVQRCSGCCNGRTLQCVPIVTETRQLQMTKITYVKMRPHYEKVIIPVEDHVRCGCQPLTSAHAGRSSSTTARKPQATPPPPPAPRVAHKPPPPPHGQAKEELHRHEQLKQHQRQQLEERGGVQEPAWASKYSPSHTAGEPPHHTPARTDYQQHRRTTPQHPLTHSQTGDRDGEAGAGQMPSSAQPSFGDGGHREDGGRPPTLGHGSGDDSGRHVQGGQQQYQAPDHTQNQQQQQQGPQHDYRLTLGEQPRHRPALSGTHMLRDATTPHQPQHAPPYHHHGQPDAPVYHHGQSDTAGQTRVQPEGSSHHSGSEGSGPSDPSQPEVTSVQRAAEDTEEERTRLHADDSDTDRQQEAKSQLHHHHPHQAHPQSQPQTSTQRAVTDAPTTLRPASPSPRAQTTPRPPPLRRRRRKHRRRISKATMRAMIMVMS
ncbi:platelet-derived growth factor beta polypeptide a isoform X2 [Sardina pilchardus]